MNDCLVWSIYDGRLQFWFFKSEVFLDEVTSSWKCFGWKNKESEGMATRGFEWLYVSSSYWETGTLRHTSDNTHMYTLGEYDTALQIQDIPCVIVWGIIQHTGMGAKPTSIPFPSSGLNLTAKLEWLIGLPPEEKLHKWDKARFYQLPKCSCSLSSGGNPIII